MKLVISLATRGRPEQLVETVTKTAANLVLPNTEYIIQVDEDDKPTIDLLSRVPLDKRVKVNVGPREDTIAEKWNRAQEEEADVYMSAADDDPFTTHGFDGKILDAASLFPDGIGVVYGHLANASFPCAAGWTRKWVDQLGYIFPEYFPYWFVDHWTDDLARITGRISVADVRTDQSKVGKTQEMREPGWWASWFDAAHLIRRKEAFKIIDALDEPQWRKEMQKSTHPIVEYRSRWINDGVRRQNEQLSNWSGLDNTDPRYVRLRDKAVAMIPELLDGMDPIEATKYRMQLLIPRLIDGAWDHDEDRINAVLKQWPL